MELTVGDFYERVILVSHEVIDQLMDGNPFTEWVH